MPPLPLITAQTEEKLLAFLTEHGHTKFRTQQVLDWVWRKRVTTFDAMSNLPPALKNLLAENFRFHTPEIVEIHGSADTTRKFLTRMEDGSLVESVIITKMDGSGKGGIAVAIMDEMHISPAFLGTGEGAEDFEPFNRDRYVDSLL